jgi:hypothetical protein
MEGLEPPEAAQPLSLLSRLMLSSHSGAQFLNQFVQVGGWGAAVLRSS